MGNGVLRLRGPTLPLCFGGRGGVRVLLEETLGAVSSEVQKAARQQVGVGACEGGGGVLPTLLFVLLALLVQRQRGERDHATSQRGELRLSALAVVLPGFVSWDGVWTGREKKTDTEAIRESLKCMRRRREEKKRQI